jgi:predicted transporter
MQSTKRDHNSHQNKKHIIQTTFTSLTLSCPASFTSHLCFLSLLPMVVSRPAMALGLILWISMATSLAMAASKFDDVIQPSWANDHVIYDGDILMLKLDNFSGIYLFIISTNILKVLIIFCSILIFKILCLLKF